MRTTESLHLRNRSIGKLVALDFLNHLYDRSELGTVPLAAHFDVPASRADPNCSLRYGLRSDGNDGIVLSEPEDMGSESLTLRAEALSHRGGLTRPVNAPGRGSLHPNFATNA